MTVSEDEYLGRRLLIVAGSISLGLGIVGIALPPLPIYFVKAQGFGSQ